MFRREAPPAVVAADSANSNFEGCPQGTLLGLSRQSTSTPDARHLRRMARVLAEDGWAPIRLRLTALRVSSALARSRRLDPNEVALLVEGFQQRRDEAAAVWALYR
jgi:hypothetical protein